MFRMHRGTGFLDLSVIGVAIKLARRYQRHFRVTQSTRREEAPVFFHSLGVGMEASEARREDGVSSADDYENLPNSAQMFASQPLLHLDHLQSLLRHVEQAPETVPSGNFYSRRRSRRSDGPSQTTWKPPRPLGEAASRSPVTAEKNREWGMWLTVRPPRRGIKNRVGG